MMTTGLGNEDLVLSLYVCKADLLSARAMVTHLWGIVALIRIVVSKMKQRGLVSIDTSSITRPATF